LSESAEPALHGDQLVDPRAALPGLRAERIRLTELPIDQLTN